MVIMSLQVHLNLKAITDPSSDFQVYKSEKEQKLYIVSKQTGTVARIYKFDGTVSNYAGSQDLKKYEDVNLWPISGLASVSSTVSSRSNSVEMKSSRSDSPESSSDRESPVVMVSCPKPVELRKTQTGDFQEISIPYYYRAIKVGNDVHIVSIFTKELVRIDKSDGTSIFPEVNKGVLISPSVSSQSSSVIAPAEKKHP